MIKAEIDGVQDKYLEVLYKAIKGLTNRSNLAASTPTGETEALSWPPNFFEEIAGVWQDDPLIPKIHDNKDKNKTKTELISELVGLRQQVAELEVSETERKQIEETLRKSEAKFRSLADTMPAAIFITQGARIRYVNAAGESISGYSRTELLAMNFWDVAHPDYRELIKARGLARERGETVPSQYEVRILPKNREICWVDLTAAVTEFEGQPAIIGTAIDITERKQAEEALRESEAKNRALLNAIPDLMFRIGKDGTYLEFKPAKGIGLLLPPNEFLGKTVDEVLPLELAQQVRHYMKRILQSGETQIYEYQLSLKGEIHHYEARLVQSGVQADEVLAIVRDITQRKERETLVEAERARIGRDLHDGLAQSLYFLGLKLDYLRKQVSRDPEGVSGELQALKETVQANIDNVRRTIFALRPIDLQKLGFGPALRRYVLEFGEQVGLEIILNVQGDEGALPATVELVFFHLVRESLNNIAKHANTGRAWIELTVTSDQTGRLTIRDDGAGFDSETLPAAGDGKLGLRQMQERVARLDGHFSLESRPGRGTTVHVEIPL
jgi:PAS domain S-box-containing protein